MRREKRRQKAEGRRQERTTVFSSSSVFCFLLSAFCLLYTACSSAPPPPVLPVAVAQANRAAETGRKLSANENWSAAVREWQNVVDRYRLLNDRANEAIALHNLAQADRALGELDRACPLLEQAADLNQQLGRNEEWWRNQIALLQIESLAKQTAALEARFTKLTASPPPDTQPQLQGLFFNELGQWQQRQGDFAKADETFRRAEQAMTKAGDRSGAAVVLADPPGIAASLAGEGRVLLAAGQNLPAAETCLRRAAENFRLLKKNDDRAAALRSLVECLTVQKKTAEADEAQKALAACAPARK